MYVCMYVGQNNSNKQQILPWWPKNTGVNPKELTKKTLKIRNPRLLNPFVSQSSCPFKKKPDNMHLDIFVEGSFAGVISP